MDAFCLRVEDDGRYGKFDNDSIYGDGSSVDGYRKFLIAAEQNNRTGLPSWWSEEKRNECIEFGKRGYGESRLNNMLEKHEVIEIYKDPTFPMQLRMLAEKFLLSAPGGMPGGSGAGMRRMMRMAAENGQTASLLSMDG